MKKRLMLLLLVVTVVTTLAFGIAGAEDPLDEHTFGFPSEPVELQEEIFVQPSECPLGSASTEMVEGITPLGCLWSATHSQDLPAMTTCTAAFAHAETDFGENCLGFFNYDVYIWLEKKVNGNWVEVAYDHQATVCCPGFSPLGATAIYEGADDGWYRTKSYHIGWYEGGLMWADEYTSSQKYLDFPDAKIIVDLEGDNRPEPEGWEIPIAVEIWDDDAIWIPGGGSIQGTFIGAAVGNLYFEENDGDPYAWFPAWGLPTGTSYDIWVNGEYTLANIKNNVFIPELCPEVDMSTLLEGNCNGDETIDMYDLAIFGPAFGSSAGPPASPNWDARADFTRNGVVDMYDLQLFGPRFGLSGPIQVP